MPTLHFKGKPFVQNYHLTVKYHQLVPKPSKSLTRRVSLNDNLIIHGDNLAALTRGKKESTRYFKIKIWKVSETFQISSFITTFPAPASAV